MLFGADVRCFNYGLNTSRGADISVLHKDQRVLFATGTGVYFRDFVAVCLTVAYGLPGEVDL